MIRILIVATISLLMLYGLLKTKEIEYKNTETVKIRDIIKSRFSNKKKMLTTFLSAEDFLKNKTPNDYKNSYAYYSINRKEIQEILINEINTITQNINKNGLIPIIIKNNMLILPMLYIKSVDLVDFIKELNQNKLKYNDVFNYETKERNALNKDRIFLGYSFFEIGKNKTIVVFSSPKDPDPLFTKNRRILDIINFSKISENSQEYKIETDFLVLSEITNHE